MISLEHIKKEHHLPFILVIAIAVVAFWRGAWGLMDVYLFPDSYELSSWISLAIGLAILSATNYAHKELV